MGNLSRSGKREPWQFAEYKGHDDARCSTSTDGISTAESRNHVGRTTTTTATATTGTAWRDYDERTSCRNVARITETG